MARTKSPAQLPQVISLTSVRRTRADDQLFTAWLIGDTPLITHSWSHKAKLEMLQKQTKVTRRGKEARDPQDDFVNSLYQMGKDAYGFPVTGIKNCLVSTAHKDKGIAKAAVMSALWLDADLSRVQAAYAGACCDLPLVRIWGSDPTMREDMVKIGGGVNKIASLAYRGQFTVWAIHISGHFNSKLMTADQMQFLIDEAGGSQGIGEWRPEKRGPFGTFHLAIDEEVVAWEAFAAGKGPLPVPASYQQLRAAE